MRLGNLAKVACAALTWSLACELVCLFSDPLTAVLYAVGERFEYGRRS